jgi:hypothetical protein
LGGREARGFDAVEVESFAKLAKCLPSTTAKVEKATASETPELES